MKKKNRKQGATKKIVAKKKPVTHTGIAWWIVDRLANSRHGKNFKHLFEKLNNPMFFYKGVIIKQGAGLKFNKEKGRRYNPNPIKLKSGEKILVTTQWTEDALKKLISINRKLK